MVGYEIMLNTTHNDCWVKRPNDNTWDTIPKDCAEPGAE